MHGVVKNALDNAVFSNAVFIAQCNAVFRNAFFINSMCVIAVFIHADSMNAISKTI